MRFITICLLLACSPAASEYGRGRTPRYWKDPNAGLCFAEFLTAYNFYTSTSVPCTPEVEALIKVWSK